MSYPIAQQVGLMWRVRGISVVLVVSLGCQDHAALDPSPSEDLTGASHDQARVTFSRDVAPILDKNCAVCHHPGGSAPFALLTYADAKTRAEQLVEVTETRYMPPWLPDPTYAHFAGERWLNEEDIDTIDRWVLLGAHEGDPAERPAPPEFTSDWQLGEPDLVIRMPQAYPLAAGGTDVFRNFVVPVPVTETRYVQGLEFRPGNVDVVHHANFRLDPTNSSRLADDRDELPGFDGMQRTNARMPGGHMLGWVPGKTPFTTADDMGWRLEPGTDFVFELHLQPTGKPEDLQCAVGLYFTDQPPGRVPFLLRLGSQTIDISAGDVHYVIHDTYKLPADVEVMGIYPHAHYLAHEMRGWAKLPDGATKWLIRIPEWDFNWQDMFQLVEPVLLPQGTTVEMEFTYDNSAQNVRNPNPVPQRVVYGPKTTDSMGDLWLQVLPAGREDWQALADDYRRKSLQDMVEGIVHTLKVDPDNAVAHYNMGLLFFQHGKPNKAQHHFERALQIDPGFADPYNNLGTLFGLEGNHTEAIQYFRKALERNSDYLDAHLNLGIALQLLGRIEKAAIHYQHVLRLQPKHLRARHNLAKTLLAQKMYDEAVDHLRESLRLDPESSAILADLRAAEQLQKRAGGTTNDD